VSFLKFLFLLKTVDIDEHLIVNNFPPSRCRQRKDLKGSSYLLSEETILRRFEAAAALVIRQVSDINIVSMHI